MRNLGMRNAETERRRIECGMRKPGGRMTEDGERMTDINEQNAAFATPDIFK